jgi:hypothetical protein
MGLNQFNCGLTIIKVSDEEPGHLPVDRRGHPPVRLLS